MKLKNISPRVLRFFRVATAILAVFLISTSISLYKSKTSPEIWLAVGALALVVLCVEFYTLLTFSDTTDRIVLVVLMLLLILCDFLAYLQVKKYFKR